MFLVLWFPQFSFYDSSSRHTHVSYQMCPVPATGHMSLSPTKTGEPLFFPLLRAIWMLIITFTGHTNCKLQQQLAVDGASFQSCLGLPLQCQNKCFARSGSSPPWDLNPCLSFSWFKFLYCWYIFPVVFEGKEIKLLQSFKLWKCLFSSFIWSFAYKILSWKLIFLQKLAGDALFPLSLNYD